jgi:hypothetical protein
LCVGLGLGLQICYLHPPLFYYPEYFAPPCQMNFFILFYFFELYFLFLIIFLAIINW